MLCRADFADLLLCIFGPFAGTFEPLDVTFWPELEFGGVSLLWHCERHEKEVFRRESVHIQMCHWSFARFIAQTASFL